jgi:hypothetical protein
LPSMSPTIGFVWARAVRGMRVTLRVLADWPLPDAAPGDLARFEVL